MFSRLAVFTITVSLLLAGCSTDPLVARLEENPMANPTLSFTEASSSRISESAEGDGDPNLTFVRLLAQTDFFPIEAELVEQGRDELIDQARAAGFELMRDPGGAVDENGESIELWVGRNEEAMMLFLDVAEDRLTVTLFLDG